MPLELSKDIRQTAIASIERYFREHMDEPIGNIAAAGRGVRLLAQVRA